MSIRTFYPFFGSVFRKTALLALAAAVTAQAVSRSATADGKYRPCSYLDREAANQVLVNQEPSADFLEVLGGEILLAGGQSGGGGGDFDGIDAVPFLESLMENLSNTAASDLQRKMLSIGSDPRRRIFMIERAPSQTLTRWAVGEHGVKVPLIYLARDQWAKKDLAGREGMIYRELCELAKPRSGASCKTASARYEESRRKKILESASAPIDCTLTLIESVRTPRGTTEPGRILGVSTLSLNQPGSTQMSESLGVRGEFTKKGSFSLAVSTSRGEISIPGFDPLNDPSQATRFVKDVPVENRGTLRSVCSRRR